MALLPVRFKSWMGFLGILKGLFISGLPARRGSDGGKTIAQKRAPSAKGESLFPLAESLLQKTELKSNKNQSLQVLPETNPLISKAPQIGGREESKAAKKEKPQKPSLLCDPQPFPEQISFLSFGFERPQKKTESFVRPKARPQNRFRSSCRSCFRS
jgi:hypothetical protein